MRNPDTRRFSDRRQAGELLAESLEAYAGRDDVIVCGLPRGGVPVAYEVARRLDADLDVVIVRKLGVPGHEELAMGAVASGGVLVRNDWVIDRLGITDARIATAVDSQRTEVADRERRFRGDRPARSFEDRTVIVVDDGIATGSTMRASIEALRESGAGAVVIAVPVASHEAYESLSPLADEMICLRTPEPFQAVGLAYDDFDQTTDQEVRRLLEKADSERARG